MLQELEKTIRELFEINPQMTRRRWCGFVLGSLGLLAAACDFPLIKDIRAKDVPQGKFLNYDPKSREFSFTDNPETTEIKITLQPEQSKAYDGQIVVRRRPRQGDELLLFDPKKIKAEHAIRVFGGTVGTKFDLEYKGGFYPGGVWYALTDRNGNFIDPLGKPLSKKEPPFYIPGAFIMIKK